MAGLELSICPGFWLLAAWLYFWGGGGAVTAFLSALLAHELGHLTAMHLSGAHWKGLRLTASGPVLDYTGVLTGQQEMGVAAAGPVAGLLFAGFCALMDTPYFRYAGAIALLAAFFNLLPALPMDGGRLAQCLLEDVFSPETTAKILRFTGTVSGLCVAVTGIFVGSVAAAGAGIWITVLANAPDLR